MFKATGEVGEGTQPYALFTSLDSHKRIIQAVDFAENSRIFATGSKDKTLKLWKIHETAETAETTETDETKEESRSETAAITQFAQYKFDKPVTAVAFLGLDILAVGLQNGGILICSVDYATSKIVIA